MRKGLLSVGLVGVLFLAGCGGGAPGVFEDSMIRSDKPLERAELTSDAGIVAANRALGLNLLKGSSETLVISPASLSIALSMLGTSAEGGLEDELTELLGANGEVRDQTMNATMESLHKYDKDISKLNLDDLPDESTVHFANQVVLDDEFTPKDSYLDNLASWYDAEVLEADLSDGASKKLLDEWVEYHTAGLIKESTFKPSATARFVLQNAALFAGRWQTPFDTDLTDTDTFTLEDGKTLERDFMKDERGEKYAEADGWAMLELPYDDRLVARFVLPPKGTPVSSVTTKTLGELEETLEVPLAGVDMKLPLIEAENSIELIKPLERLGLAAPFTDAGDPLAHILPDNGLFVSQITQQVKLEVTEDKTVAAAVTELGLDAAAGPDDEEEVKYFHADRPFIMTITDKETNLDLFMSVIHDPITKN